MHTHDVNFCLVTLADNGYEVTPYTMDYLYTLNHTVKWQRNSLHLYLYPRGVKYSYNKSLFTLSQTNSYYLLNS